MVLGKRKIIWFNPPYSKSVATNVGKHFLKLLEKHFPKHHKFRKIFNKNTVKVSYSCLPNINAKVNRHNKKILTSYNGKNDQPPSRLCNCPSKNECPLENNCLEKDVQYSGELTNDLDNSAPKIYKGICSTTFKERLGNHKKSFNHEKYEADSELSKEVWRIKRKGGNFAIKWRKDRKYLSYKPEIGKCSLCNNEKLEIALYKGDNLLNKRNEIISTCRHGFKYKLVNLTF